MGINANKRVLVLFWRRYKIKTVGLPKLDGIQVVGFCPGQQGKNEEGAECSLPV